jgi:transposase-like protein
VQLAISDAHGGLKAAIAKVLGCAWQRCTVHYANVRVMPIGRGEAARVAVGAVMGSA